MRALPWPRLGLLAALVAGAHWWAIDGREADRPPVAIAQGGSVVVMSAAPVAPAVGAEPVGASAAPLTAPKPAPRAASSPPRAILAAASLDVVSMRPAFEPAPPAERAALSIALPTDEAAVRADTVLPPAVEPAELLAQASPPMKPTGDVSATPGADAPVPTYRTKPPAAAKLAYRLSRGPIVGTGQIDWRPASGGYSLQLEGSVPIVGTLITQMSRGRIDATGLAPERHTDRRLRRGEQAANFDRAAGSISFSGQAPELPLTAGVQDRVSVMIQLPAIVNAWVRMPPVGEQVLIRVVGARGDAHVWTLRFEGMQAVELPDGRVNALRFLREPEGPNDTRAEFWLDPARQHLPVKMVLTDGKGEALELLRTP